MFLQRSLIGRVMTAGVLASVVIIAVVSVVVYRVTFDEISEYQFDKLQQTTIARAHSQMVVFERLEQALEEARGTYYQVLDDLEPAASRERFERFFPEFGDGTRRSASSIYDGLTNPYGHTIYGMAGFIPKASEMTTARRREVMSGFETVRQFGPSLHGQIPNFWFFTNHGDIIVFAPDRPNELRPYRYELPADFDFSDQEVAKLGSLVEDPDRVMRCGKLNPMVYEADGTNTVLTSSCQIPVDDEIGNHIGSFGVTLALTGWMNDTVRTAPDENFRFILMSPRYGMMAHSSLDAAAPGGSAADVERTGDTERVDLLAPLLVGNTGVFTFEGTNSVVAYATIDGPEWLLVSIQPQGVIAEAAAAAAFRAAMATWRPPFAWSWP